jgi:hypothetical protein
VRDASDGNWRCLNSRRDATIVSAESRAAQMPPQNYRSSLLEFARRATSTKRIYVLQEQALGKVCSYVWREGRRLTESRIRNYTGLESKFAAALRVGRGGRAGRGRAERRAKRSNQAPFLSLPPTRQCALDFSLIFPRSPRACCQAFRVGNNGGRLAVGAVGRGDDGGGGVARGTRKTSGLRPSVRRIAGKSGAPAMPGVPALTGTPFSRPSTTIPRRRAPSAALSLSRPFDPTGSLARATAQPSSNPPPSHRRRTPSSTCSFFCSLVPKRRRN